MTVLFWGKPKKVRSKEKWAEHYGFEDGPTGGYEPNMSEEDKSKWKAKLTGTKLGYPQVEIRKSGTVIVVNLGKGFNYKQYRSENEDYTKFASRKEWIDAQEKRYPRLGRKWFEEKYDEDYFHKLKHPTEGIAVHISSAGPIQWTMDEYKEFVQAVEEAKQALEKLKGTT